MTRQERDPSQDTGTTKRRFTRRDILRGTVGIAAVAAAGTGAVTTFLAGDDRPGRGRTQVMVIWSGGELDRFLEVLSDYDEGPVEVTSAGDDMDALLRARRRAGNSPDVAILSRPGLIRGYQRQGWLSPLPETLGEPFPQAWTDLLRFDDGQLYGVWVKAAHKSMFWRLPSTPGISPDQGWDGLVSRVRRWSDGDGPAPLAIGAADGWVLTDWFENLLAAHTHNHEELYAALARGEDRWDHELVREAFADLGRLWQVGGAFAGGGRRALLTQFDQSVVQVATHEASMLYAADFVTSVADRFLTDDERLEPFRFPSPTGHEPLVVGGDAAVVFDGSERGHKLVEFLTRGVRFQPWVDAGGYLTSNEGVDVDDYPRGLRRLANDVRDASVRFDLSDQLPALLNGLDGQGSWAILQDFFSDVAAERIDLDRAIARATSRFSESSRQARAQELAG